MPVNGLEREAPTIMDESLPGGPLLGRLTPILATTHDRLAALAGAVSDALFRTQPLPGEWSPYQVTWHLIDTESLVFPVRIRAILAGELAVAAIDPNATVWDETVPTGTLVERFAALRADTLALLATLTPADVDRTIEHAEYGTVTMGQMLHYYPAHDLTHLVQIERALMQPFIPGAGPWGANIADMRMR